MNEGLLKGYPGTPPRFHETMMQTLKELEQMKRMRKRKLRVVLCAALISGLLLAGAAYAAVVHWGVMGSPFIEPLETAREQVQLGLGSAEDERMRVTVAEAAYDGVAIHIAVEFEPKHPDRVVLGPDGEDTFEINGNTYEYTLSYSKIAEETARELVRCPVNLVFPQLEQTRSWALEGQIGDFRWHGHTMVLWSLMNERVDEKLVYNIQSLVIPSPLPENMEVEIECLDGQRISFHLEQTQPTRVVDLAAQDSIEGIDIVSARLVFTDFASYLDVFYTTARTQRDSDLWNVELSTVEDGQKATHSVGGMDIEFSPGGHAGTRYRAVYAAQTDCPQEVRLRFLYDGQVVGETACAVREEEP